MPTAAANLIVMPELVLSKLEMFLSSDAQFRQAPAGIHPGPVQLVLVADKKCGFKLARRYQRLSYCTAAEQH